MRRTEDIFPKTIHGQPVEQQAFRRFVCDTLESLPEGGRTLDLIEALGPEWNSVEHKRILTKTIDNLVNTGLVHRAERGVYKTTPAYQRRGASLYAVTEKTIVDMLRAAGGFMTRVEILDGFGLSYRSDYMRFYATDYVPRQQALKNLPPEVREMDSPRSASITKTIDKVLEESPLIRSDTQTVKIVNLRPEELHALPLRGLFAGYLIAARFLDVTGSIEGAMEERDEFFTRVGAAFYEARRMRGYRTARDFIQEKRVMAEIIKLAEMPAIKSEGRNWFAGETQAKVDEMVAAGATPQQVADFRADREESREGLEHYVDVLDRFEKGGEGKVGVNCHLNAPLSFYTALAETLEFDAAMLSRGIIFSEMKSEQSRPKVGTGARIGPNRLSPK